MAFEIKLSSLTDPLNGEAAIVAKKHRLTVATRFPMRVIGITATRHDGTPVGERQELRPVSMDVPEPIVVVRNERALQALITHVTGYTQKERKRLKIKADVNAA